MNKKTVKYSLAVITGFCALVLISVLAFNGVRRALVENYEVMAHSVAQGLLPALLVDDAQQVEVLVKALEANPAIESAELLNAQGASVASFSRHGDLQDGVSGAFALASAEQDPYVVRVIAPITFDSLIVANLHVAINLWPIYVKIMTWLGFFLIVPSVIYVLIKHFRLKLRFEVIGQGGGSDGGGDAFDVQKAVSIAMRDADVSIEYQPIQRMSDSGSFGMEVVVSWRHPSGQTIQIAPGDFVALAERNQISLPFDEWVLLTACSQAAVWQHQYGPLILAVNISASQFNDPTFAHRVRAICEQAQYPYQLLELEVRESAVLKDVRQALKNMEVFAEQGLSLTVDHFGLSTQSWDALTILPVDKVKLNRNLVNQVCVDEQVNQHIHSLVAQALIHDVQVMADGVETHDQRDALQRAGCILGQGRYFSPPLTSAAFEIFIKNRSFEKMAQRGLNNFKPTTSGSPSLSVF